MQAIYFGNIWWWLKEIKQIICYTSTCIYKRNCSNNFKITDIENEFILTVIFKNGTNQDPCTFNLNVEMILNLIPRH